MSHETLKISRVGASQISNLAVFLNLTPLNSSRIGENGQFIANVLEYIVPTTR